MFAEKKKQHSQEEKLSSDIRAFCALIARIMLRCLKEKDARMMKLLALPDESQQPDLGGKTDEGRHKS